MGTIVDTSKRILIINLSNVKLIENTEVGEKQKPSSCQLNLTIKRKRRPKLPGGRQRRQNNRKMQANLRRKREKNRRQPRPRKTRKRATLTNQINKIPAVQVHI